MEELQVPTHSVDVLVYTGDGCELHGSLFLPQQFEPCCSALVALLHDERAFIPFEVHEEGYERRPMLLNKEHIVRLHVELAEVKSEECHLVQDAFGPDSEFPSDPHHELGENESAPRVPARLTLADGSELEGFVDVDTPWQDSRLIDKLNLAEPFVPIRSATGIDIVGRRHIARAL